MELPLYERLRTLVEALGEPSTNMAQIKENEEALTQIGNVSCLA